MRYFLTTILLLLSNFAFSASISGSNTTDLVLPDSGVTVYNTISISSAPANATITSVEVTFQAVHPYSIDLQVDLEIGAYSNSKRLWNNEGGGIANPSRTVTTSDFNGLPVNSTWYLSARDTFAGETGYIDKWSIVVTYTAPDSGDDDDVVGVDLEPHSVTLSSDDVTPGDSLTVNWKIRNNGTAAAASSDSQVRITASSGSSGTSLDKVGTEQATGTIAAGQSISQSAIVTAPTTPGTYYVWIVADNKSVLTQSTNANDFAASGSFTVSNLSTTIDVEPLDVTLGSSSVSSGGLLSVSWQIRNNGTGSAPSSYSQLRITSSSSSSGTSLNNVGSGLATGIIGAGETISQITTVTVPTTPGTYYVWVVADNEIPKLAQSNANNDVAVSSAFTILVATPTISAVVPNVVTGSTKLQTILIKGANFTNKPVLILSSVGHSKFLVPYEQVKWISSTQLQMSVIITPDADIWSIQATNPDGKASNLFGFRVYEAVDDGIWPAPYNGITVNQDSAFEYNNIGVYRAPNEALYSCVKIYTNGSPDSIGGIAQFDIIFKILSASDGIVQISNTRKFNELGVWNEYGELPSCSGTYESTTDVYEDIFQVGEQVFKLSFDLFDRANLKLKLNSSVDLTDSLTLLPSN